MRRPHRRRPSRLSARGPHRSLRKKRKNPVQLPARSTTPDASTESGLSSSSRQEVKPRDTDRKGTTTKTARRCFISSTPISSLHGQAGRGEHMPPGGLASVRWRRDCKLRREGVQNGWSARVTAGTPSSARIRMRDGDARRGRRPSIWLTLNVDYEKAFYARKEDTGASWSVTWRAPRPPTEALRSVS